MDEPARRTSVVSIRTSLSEEEIEREIEGVPIIQRRLSSTKNTAHLASSVKGMASTNVPDDASRLFRAVDEGAGLKETISGLDQFEASSQDEGEFGITLNPMHDRLRVNSKAAAQSRDQETQTEYAQPSIASTFIGNEDHVVDEMKIQTMYKMVEDITVSINGKSYTKKFLYLTNKQAAMFDARTIERCVQALDIGDPKCVIRLMQSASGKQTYSVHTEFYNKGLGMWGEFQPHGSDLDAKDVYVCESQLAIFFETCLLPLAKQTNALIVVSGANDCTLAAALERVVAPEQARLGKDCPFTVLCTTYLVEVYSKAVSGGSGSLASQLFRQSTTWSNRSAFLANHNSKWKNADMQQCDVTASASHGSDNMILNSYKLYITCCAALIVLMFECIDVDAAIGKYNGSLKESFDATILGSLTRKLPSIAIATHNMCDPSGLADLVRRSVPVFLLDTRERAFSSAMPEGGLKTALAKRAEGFPTLTLEQAKDLERGELQVDTHGGLAAASRRVLISIALDMLRREAAIFSDAGVINTYGGCDLAFMHSVLRFGSRLHDKSSESMVELQECIFRLKDAERKRQGSEQQLVPVELVNIAIEFLQNEAPANIVKQQLSRVEKWIRAHEETHPMYEAAKDDCESLRQQVAVILENGGSIGNADQSKWLDLYHILTSPYSFSGSIHDLSKCKVILGSVVRIDRLPEANSLQALLTLRDSWDHIEYYHAKADGYKKATKWSYVALLAAGIIVTAAALVQSNFDYLAVPMRFIILAMSLLGSAVASYVSFMNPGQRWRQLRGAALTMQSHIWRFRTRAGEYRINQSDFASRTDRLLYANMASIKASVYEGADVKNTAFFGQRQSLNLHKQHPSGARGFGFDDRGDYHHASAQVTSEMHKAAERKMMLTLVDTNGDGSITIDEVAQQIEKELDFGRTESLSVVDTHYSPLQPDAFILCRIEPAVRFYSGRVPFNNSTLNIGKCVLVLGSMVGVLLVIFNLSVWAAAVSIFSSGVTAWLEFNGVSSKMTRYSAVVDGLQSLTVWWHSLDMIDKSVVENIDKLVLSCEEIIKSEYESWSSAASKATEMLDEAANDAKSK